jgi:enamine deaminase RidA (YjgF/YER057c/UK114 family)
MTLRKETFSFTPNECVPPQVGPFAHATKFGSLVYLTSFDDFDVFNIAYATWFRGPLPSRTCVGVSGLAVGAAVEIDLIAGIPEGQ